MYSILRYSIFEQLHFPIKNAYTFLTQSSIRSEFQYFAIQKESEKIPDIKDVKNI